MVYYVFEDDFLEVLLRIQVIFQLDLAVTCVSFVLHVSPEWILLLQLNVWVYFVVAHGRVGALFVRRVTLARFLTRSISRLARKQQRIPATGHKVDHVDGA